MYVPGGRGHGSYACSIDVYICVARLSARLFAVLPLTPHPHKMSANKTMNSSELRAREQASPVLRHILAATDLRQAAYLSLLDVETLWGGVDKILRKMSAKEMGCEREFMALIAPGSVTLLIHLALEIVSGHKGPTDAWMLAPRMPGESVGET